MLRTVFFASLFIEILSLSTGIDSNKHFCSQVQGKSGQSLTITYVSSGFQEDQLEVKLTDPRGIVIQTIMKKKEHTHKEFLKMDGLYEVCFKPLDKYYKLISFDFDFSDEEQGVVLAETIDQVGKDLKEAYRELQKISKNQHYQSDREQTHQSMLEQTEKKLQWCSFIKMIVLVLICVSQIYLLTGFFKNKSFSPSV